MHKYWEAAKECRKKYILKIFIGLQEKIKHYFFLRIHQEIRPVVP